MVWMLGLAELSMAGVLDRVEASVMRRPTPPPPDAVLKGKKGGGFEMSRVKVRHT